MSRKRRQYSADFKAKVALAALKAGKTHENHHTARMSPR